MNESEPGKGESAFVVTRKIPLNMVPEEKLREAISQIMVKEPVIGAKMDKRNYLHVTYDASFICIHDIEAWLDDLAITRKSDPWWHLKSAWYAFLDENAKSNATSTGGACCNRPPSGGNSDAGRIR